MPSAEPDQHAIEVHLDRLLAERGLTLTERAGVTIVNLSILKNGHARAIRFTTLTRPRWPRRRRQPVAVPGSADSIARSARAARTPTCAEGTATSRTSRPFVAVRVKVKKEQQAV